MPTPKPSKSPVAVKDTKAEVTLPRPNNYVYMEKSVTKNLGDYNSAKITVGLTVQVNPTPAELKQLQTTVDLLDEVLDKEMEEQVKNL
jgi:hypothetical protein